MPSNVILIIVCSCILLLMIRLFFSPLKIAVTSTIKTIFGFLWLAIFNMFSASLGFTLGFNILNALVIGILGFPGFVLLLFSKYVLM